MIEFRQVCAGYGEDMVLRDISIQIPKGKITTLIGPNGCGKTTLLRAAARQLPIRRGEILMKGRPLSAFDRLEFARTAAFLPQVRAVPSISVRELVSHGRFPYLGLSRQLRAGDREKIAWAMEETAVERWSGRNLRELSGGERQRVYLAMVLAQDTDVIFLDEPTTYLDLHQQFEVLELIQSLNRQGKTIVMVLHDLAHALSGSDRIVLMQRGRPAICGAPEEIVRSGAVDQVFHVKTRQAEGIYFFAPEP